jgi:hypothetical protein
MLARTSLAALLVLAACTSGPTGNGSDVMQNGGNGGGNGAGNGNGGAAALKGCTYTQGYWKNHPQAWPMMSLTIGGVTYTQAQLLTIFDTAPGGDASLILAHQLIAAMLNVANGAQAPGAITTAISQAQAWMTANLPPGGRLGYGISSSSLAGQQATMLSEQLDGFNSGMAGVPHCGDSAGGGDTGGPGGTGGPNGGSGTMGSDGGTGGSTGGGSTGGGPTGGCPNGCSDGGVDPCAGVMCPSGYACFQGVCQPPII